MTIALTLADAGADIAICARKLPELEATVDEIRAKGKKALAVASHVAKVEEVQSLVEKVKAEFGRIDVLVNNAGTNPYYGPLIDADEWAWDTTMNVNLKAPFMLSQKVARIMKEQGGGNIINMSSVGGIRASTLYIYSVTKAALIMLTKSMAKEWGRYNIRVNAIAPGVIKTRLREALWKAPEKTKEKLESQAINRLGVPDDIASAALYLASDAGSYVTGETIVVDGGELIGPSPSFE